MIYVPRDYQETSIRLGVECLTHPAGGNGVLVLPTGSGKSIIIAGICAQLDSPCLVFQPSVEILQQNFHKLLHYGFQPGIYSASAGQKRIRGITLATIGSVKNKARLFEQFRYVIIDECHTFSPKGGMMAGFLEQLQGRVLGLTATPYRLSTDGYGGSILKFLTRTRPRVFTKVVHVVQNGDLFAAGHLAKLRYTHVPGFDRTKLRANSTGADFTDESVLRHYEEIHFAQELVRVVRKCLSLGRRGTLVFTRFIAEAEQLARLVPGVEVVTGETPKEERKAMLRRFKSGQTKVIANVGVLTVGFDYPELDTVVLARPTKSLALTYQMIGRILRPHPSKEHGLVVDMVQLVEQFGHVEDLRIEERDGKWAVFSQDRQLTNVYYGQESAGETDATLPATVAHLKFEKPVELNGHFVRRAVPDSKFWSQWRNNKGVVIAQGVSVIKNLSGQYLVQIAASPTTETKSQQSQLIQT